MQARYVILRVLLEAGNDLVMVEKLTNPTDGEADLIISLDRSKINTTGKEAIGNFLRKLQVCPMWTLHLKARDA
jgi:dipeptidyl-peptidase-3